MLYFKHSDLVDKYHISLKTVHNWIDATKQGKIGLDLYEKGSRVYIANNPGNIAALERLVDEGKKYRNSRFNKVVSPNSEFYSLYSKRQILDIISNLKIHHEIPRQYNYFNGGADNWDNWLQRLEQEESANILNSTLKLVHTNLAPIDLLLQGHKRINIIDLGVGNAKPVKELLEHLLERDVVHRYVAVDISKAMLDIAERNIKDWFGDRVKYEGHVRDLTFERFDDLLVDDMLDKNADNTINLVLLFGATPTNTRSFTDMLSVAYNSMGASDLIIYTDKADTQASRSYFDFNPKPGSSVLSPSHRYILELLNIDESLYDVEMGYDKEKRQRYVRIRLKQALTIKFKFDDGEQSVTLEKGSTILLLRVWHLTSLEIISKFEEVGFKMLHASVTPDRQYLLTISGVEAQATHES